MKPFICTLLLGALILTSAGCQTLPQEENSRQPSQTEQDAQTAPESIPDPGPLSKAPAADGEVVSHAEKNTSLDGLILSHPEQKNADDLVKFVRFACAHHWGYVWGTFGQVLTEPLFAAKLEQYPGGVGRYEALIRQKWLGGRTVDCTGLIKAYGWLDTQRMEIFYATNGFPDVTCDHMASDATVKGLIGTMPEVPGLAVWRSGHIGVYIGGGKVIEAKGTYFGVVETDLSAGSWTHWLQIPYISYS